MEENADKKIAELKDRLENGEYAVDPTAVADAILRRSRDLALLKAQLRASGDEPGNPPAQRECSYPIKPDVPFRLGAHPSKRSSGDPATTRPIQVIRSLPGRLASFASIPPQAPGGAQAQSS